MLDFNLSTEQQILKDAARSFLQKECPPALTKEILQGGRNYDHGLWKKMVDMGWMAIDLPEEYGGYGTTFLDLVILLEEMGRVSLVSPFLPTITLGKYLLLFTGNDKQKKSVLPSIAKGEVIVTVGFNEEGTAWDPNSIKTQAIRKNGKWFLIGKKLNVPDANLANYIIVAAKPPQDIYNEERDLMLFLIRTGVPGLKILQDRTIPVDCNESVFLENVEVSAEDIVGSKGHNWKFIEQALNRANIGKCAMMIGGAEKVLELTIAYAKEREQFGRPIGSFQSIQHYCADMLIELKGAEFLTHLAAWKIANDAEDPKDVSTAKIYANRTFSNVCLLSHKIVGAIGFTDEHDLHLYTKRLVKDLSEFGDEEFHRRVLINAIGI
jgi:alkylation response protein AidB-like acyl-CoA dehydrogenase